MISKEKYEHFMKHATKKQLGYIKAYCETLDKDYAYEQSGYSYSDKNLSMGKCVVFNKLFPYMQYKMSKEDSTPSKEWIMKQWMKYIDDDNKLISQNALKELGKIANLYEPENKIEINNNMPQTPVVISFNDNDNDK